MKFQEIELESFLEKGKVELPKDCTLRKVFKVNEYLWLLLRFPNYHEEQDTNIWCFDGAGELIWKIERMSFPSESVCPYSNIYEEKGKIFAYNCVGFHMQIDPETGKIIGQKKGRPW